MLNFLQKYKVELCIFILALTVRLLFLGLSYSAHDGNLTSVINAGDGYYEIAQNIIAGHGYSTAHELPYTPTAYRTPVTSYFIAWMYLLFGSYVAAIFVHLVLGSIIPLLGMKLSRFITDMRVVPIAVGISLALEPVGALLSIQFLSETLFTFLFLLSVLYLFQYWKNKLLTPLLLSAFFLGASTLTRPTVEYLPIIIITLILWEARTHLSRTVFVRAGLYVLVFLITLSPWLYRNYRTFGALGISSQQGASLYAIVVPSVLAIHNGTNFSQEIIAGIAGPNAANFAQSAEYSKLAIPILLNHPKAFALLYINTAFSFFTYDGIFEVLRYIRFNNFDVDGGMFAVLSQAKLNSGIPLGTPTLFLLLSAPIKVLQYLVAISTTPLLFILIGRASWFLITCAFFAGVWRLLRHERQNIYGLAAASVVIYMMLTTIAVGFTITTRYRMPVNAFIFTLAACGAVLLASWCRKKFYTMRRKPMM